LYFLGSFINKTPTSISFDGGEEKFNNTEDYLITRYSEIDNKLKEKRTHLKFKLYCYIGYDVIDKNYYSERIEMLKKFDFFLNQRKFYDNKPRLCNSKIIVKEGTLTSKTDTNYCVLQYVALDSCD